MSNKNTLNVRHKTLYLAVATALPLLMAGGQAYAACTSANGIVNCNGTFAGGSTGGAIMVVPSNYTAVSTDRTGNTASLSTTIIGVSNRSDFTISSVGGMNVSVPKFSILNIGSGSTTPIYGVAPDSTTTVVTGLKAVPGFFDPFNRIDTTLSTLPAIGDTPAQQATKLLNAKPLVNFEGVDIQQAGTVNNFGVITNTAVGNNITPVAGNTFLVANGPKVYTEGGADNLPYRTIGVFVNGDDTKLNNYGVINVGINNAAIAASQPGVSAPMYTGTGGTAFAETFCQGMETTGICVGKPAGTILTVTTGSNKPVVYGVAATADGDDFYQNVHINNYNKISAYNFTTGSVATVVGVEVKENIIDTHIMNAPGAVIEGVSSQLVAGTGRSLAGTVTNGIGKNTYGTSTGGVQAIGTDNNAFQLFVDNYGTIQSTNVAGNVYGTAIGSSTGEMYLTNYATAKIFGDITVGASENKFVFTNAGILTGSIKITPDASSLTPVLQDDGSYLDVATPLTTTNKIIIQPVINAAGGGNTITAVGQITGGIYVASATGKHPFELDVQPLVATGVTIKSGDTYQFSANNISVQSGAKGTPNNPDGTAGSAAAQIDNTNIHVLSSALVNWAFAGSTTNTVVASVADASTIAGLSGSGQVALNALMNSVSGAGDGAGSFVQNLVSTDDVRKAGEQLRPEINGANIQTALNVTNKVFGLVDSHLNETHLAEYTGKSGIATGEQPSGTGVWMQGFGFRGDQDVREGVDGYSADAYGFAIGADRLINTDTRLGGAFSYANSNIDDKGVNSGNHTKIDSYQATLYSSMLMDNWYLNGALGLGKHHYDSNRLVLGANVNGSHEAWQYSAKIDAGLPVKVSSATITPVASLTYSRLNQDAYTETGLGALAIRSSDTNSLRSGLGAKALIPVYEGDVKAALELHAIWSHEFGNTEQNTTANFIGGGSEFTTNGVSAARNGADLGVSLRLSGSDNVMKQNLLLSYDAEIKDQYFSQTVLLQARFDF